LLSVFCFVGSFMRTGNFKVLICVSFVFCWFIKFQRGVCVCVLWFSCVGHSNILLKSYHVPFLLVLAMFRFSVSW
jgi:hypothetical protein